MPRVVAPWLLTLASLVWLLTPHLAHGQASTFPSNWDIASPDGQLVLTLSIQNDGGRVAKQGRLLHAVTFRGQIILKPSRLGLALAERPNEIGWGVQATGFERFDGVEAYALLHGKTAQANDPYNGAMLWVESLDASRTRMGIEAKVFNNAVAFRYHLPEQDDLDGFHLTTEHTEWTFDDDPMAWALHLPNERSMYESEYVQASITAWTNQGGVASDNLVGLPLLMHLPGRAWLALMEADIHNTAAMYLTNATGSWTGTQLSARLAQSLEEPNTKVTAQTPWHGAWRVLQIADDPGDLVTSTVLTSLNPPAKIENTDWIKPGLASWDWWSGRVDEQGQDTFHTEGLKRYIDFAAEAGLEYFMLDAGWSHWDITQCQDHVDVPELVDYAKAKGVGVWLWIPYDATTLRMEEAFATYERWGVVGVKLDFIERNDQQGIAFYHAVAETAAKHHLMVDFHGGMTPWGMERTWPNVLGFEAVIGLEQNKGGRRDQPALHTVLPFTRMLVHQMDQTPGGFDQQTMANFRPRDQRPMVMGSRAHQLALYTVGDAPFQMVSDDPSVYRLPAVNNQTQTDQGKWAPGFAWLKDTPRRWDETKVLAGAPGHAVAIARRVGDTWHLGLINGDLPTNLSLDLSVLGNGPWHLKGFKDGPSVAKDPKVLIPFAKDLDASKPLLVELQPHGGWVGKLQPMSDKSD